MWIRVVTDSLLSRLKGDTMTTLKQLSITLVLLISASTAGFAQQFSDWYEPVNLGSVVNSVCAIGSTACSDQHPAISKDGLSLYFSSNRPGGCGGLDIWVSQRASADSPWEAPFNLGCTINSSTDDMAVSLSTDGHKMYFHSFHATDNCGGGDIYVSYRQNRRDDRGWQEPINLNRIGRDPAEGLPCGGVNSTTLVNTPNTDAGPTIFNDQERGLTILYFTRTDQVANVGDFDIYTATLGLDGTWGTVNRDNELSTTPYRDTRTAIRRRDGLEMILSSERPGGLGAVSRDLWFSTRASTYDLWSIPVLVPFVNSVATEGAPALSWDGTELYFFSNKLGASAGNDLYVSTRTKIGGQP